MRARVRRWIVDAALWCERWHLRWRGHDHPEDCALRRWLDRQDNATVLLAAMDELDERRALDGFEDQPVAASAAVTPTHERDTLALEVLAARRAVVRQRAAFPSHSAAHATLTAAARTLAERAARLEDGPEESPREEVG